jgi:transposase
MRKKRPHYAPEFRRQMVELVRAGRSPAELADEFEPTAQTIHKWVAQADRDEGRRSDGLTTPEREELNRLRRENRQLKVEREILSKAAAWFARESNAIPSKGSRLSWRALPQECPCHNDCSDRLCPSLPASWMAASPIPP